MVPLSPIVVGVASACEGAGEEEQPGFLQFQNKEEPLKIPVGNTIETSVGYNGFGSSGTLSVFVTKEPEFTYAGGTCKGKSITESELCTVKITCKGSKGAKGKTKVESSAKFVASDSKELECT
jgi:hypothetical protein